MHPRIRMLALVFVLSAITVGGPSVAKWLSPLLSTEWAPPAHVVEATRPYVAARDLLIPVHRVKRPVEAGDWLESHPELGQGFLEFATAFPKVGEYAKQPIDLQPLGEFTEIQFQIVRDVADFLEHFFQLTVRLHDPLPLADLPPEAVRESLGFGRQVLTTYINQKILAPLRQPDSAALIALTADDLWPAPGWNFLFGQADLGNRVGVWSIARFGDPHSGPEAFSLCRRRAMKVAVHETGHILGIMHCTAYECLMNGSKHLSESDRKPMEFCPECQAKIWWRCSANAHLRAKILHQYSERMTLAEPLFGRQHALWQSAPPALWQKIDAAQKAAVDHRSHTISETR